MTRIKNLFSKSKEKSVFIRVIRGEDFA